MTTENELTLFDETEVAQIDDKIKPVALAAQTGAIFFVLPLPPSANRYWCINTRSKRPCLYVSGEAKRYRRITALIFAELRRQGEFASLFKQDVRVEIDFFRPDRRTDLDNGVKQLLDVMQGVVFENDRLVTELEAKRHIDKERPRVEVAVMLA